MKNLRERILMWLFGTDDVQSYMQVLKESIDDKLGAIELIDEHRQSLNTMLKLIKICENHGIDVDEEIEHIQLDEVNANETLD